MRNSTNMTKDTLTSHMTRIAGIRIKDGELQIRYSANTASCGKSLIGEIHRLTIQQFKKDIESTITPICKTCLKAYDRDLEDIRILKSTMQQKQSSK